MQSVVRVTVIVRNCTTADWSHSSHVTRNVNKIYIRLANRFFVTLLAYSNYVVDLDLLEQSLRRGYWFTKENAASH